jgi:hypothetical protein
MLLSIVSTTAMTSSNRYLHADRLHPRLVWEQVKDSIVTSADGYLLFDDTVADKNYSHSIELVRRRYSGNTKSIIKGVGHRHLRLSQRGDFSVPAD